MQSWRKVLDDHVRPAFPRPWADHGADERFENYLKQVVERLDELKHVQQENLVFLGKPEVWILAT